MNSNNIKVTYPITIELDGIDTKSFSGLSKEQIEFVQKQIKEKAIELLTSVNTIPNSELKVFNPYRPEKLPKEKTELEKLYEIDRTTRINELMNLQTNMLRKSQEEIENSKHIIFDLSEQICVLRKAQSEERVKIRKLRNSTHYEIRQLRRAYRIREKELKRKFFIDNMNLKIENSNISDVIEKNS
jgi:hypothetical protein